MTYSRKPVTPSRTAKKSTPPPAARAARPDARQRQVPVGDRDDDDVADGPSPRVPPGLDDELGPITLPSPADAHRVLRELASLYHERHSAAQQYAALRALVKAAADALAALDARIAERIRVATHRTGLPLFAEEERTGSLD